MSEEEEKQVQKKEVEVAQKEDDVREEQAVENTNEACEELGIGEAEKPAGETTPEVYAVSSEGERLPKGTMVNVSRDTHSRLLVEKAKRGCKSFDELIRQAFNW